MVTGIGNNVIAGSRTEKELRGTDLLQKGTADTADGHSFKAAFASSLEQGSLRNEALESDPIGRSRDYGGPYGSRAKDGVIEYNGVTFVCDTLRNAICLGDMSDKKDVISIPLSEGGTLMVNRDNIDDLSKAIGMFSPEDVNRILRAIAKDAQARRKLLEIEETVEGGYSFTTRLS